MPGWPEEILTMLDVTVYRSDGLRAPRLSVWVKDKRTGRESRASGEFNPWGANDVVKLIELLLNYAVERALKPATAYGKKVSKPGVFRSRIARRRAA